MSNGRFGTEANRKAERGALSKQINKIRRKNALGKVKRVLDGGTNFSNTTKGSRIVRRTLAKTAVRIGKGKPNG